MDDERDVDDIEEALRELAEDEAPDAIAIVDGPAEGDSIPTQVPLADESYGEDGGEGEFENENEYEPLEGDAEPRERAIALAEPMTAHDAQIVALGDNVRQVTQLIESVGRTLEAQNQRSMRLMERLESVAKALEVLPEDADRNLEGLDAVGEALHAQMEPLQKMSDRLDALPQMVRAVQQQSDSTRELWNVATRALAGRLAFTAQEELERRRRESSHRRWRVLAGAALAVAAFMGGAFLSGTDMGDRARVAIGTAILGGDSASADVGDRHWRVMRVVPAPPRKDAKDAPDTKAPATAVPDDGEGPFGVDEEAPR